MTEVANWSDAKPRSGARVSWDTGVKNLYRVGFAGQVGHFLLFAQFLYTTYLLLGRWTAELCLMLSLCHVLFSASK